MLYSIYLPYVLIGNAEKGNRNNGVSWGTKNLTTQKSQFSLKGHQYTDTGRFKTVNGHLKPIFYFSGV